MAVTREGTSETFNDDTTPGTEAVTVPGDATLMVIHAHYWDATANAGISAASLDGDSFTQIGDQNSSTDDAMVDCWYLANPSTGSQTLSWTFTEAISEGPGWAVTYYKGGDTTDPIRDFDAQTNAGTDPSETGSFDSNTDDLCVVSTADYGQSADSAPTDKGQTEDQASNTGEGPQGSVGDKAGGGASETMWFGGDTYATAVAFSLKVSGGEPTAYTIECTTGTYAVTGKTLSAKWGHKAICTTGTYAVTGKTLNALVGYKAICTTGSYAITGKTLNPLWGHKIICTPGVYAVTGKTLEPVYNENMTITPAVFSLLMTFNTANISLGAGANYGDQVHMFMTMSMN